MQCQYCDQPVTGKKLARLGVCSLQCDAALRREDRVFRSRLRFSSWPGWAWNQEPLVSSGVFSSWRLVERAAMYWWID